MSTSVQIPVEEYLQTSYRPDCEYIDGELKERNVGKWEHARLQALIAGWFTAQEKTWHVMVATEQRLQVAPTRIRIPDLVVLYASEPPDVLIDPPLIVIEILSPADTYSDIQERASDYRAMGVETIWIIDPKTRTARICTGSTWTETSRLIVQNSPIYLDLSDFFPYLTQPSA